MVLEHAKVFFDQIGPLGALLFSLVSLAVSMVAFFGKWGFKEASAENKIRRDFGTSTAKRIAELADQHYWAIANAAGTLSTGLRSYLEQIELRLYVSYADGTALKADVDGDAVDASFATFPSLVQLLWSLHNFQFLGSNDYLLPQEEAGTDLRRLYNSFRTSLKSTAPGDDLITGVIQSIKKTEGKFDIQATLDAASIRKEQEPDNRAPAPLADDRMEELREAWEKWLTSNLANVLTATRSLEAFARLLRQQIGELYRDWYDLRTRTRFGVSMTRGKPRTTLSRAERDTVEMARELDDLMQPLRQAAQGPPQQPDPIGQARPRDPQPDDALRNVTVGAKTAASAGAETAINPDAAVSSRGAETAIKPDAAVGSPGAETLADG